MELDKYACVYLMLPVSLRGKSHKYFTLSPLCAVMHSWSVQKMLAAIKERAR